MIWDFAPLEVRPFFLSVRLRIRRHLEHSTNTRCFAGTHKYTDFTSLHCVLLTGVDDLSPNDMYVLLVHRWSNKWKIKVHNHIYYEDTRRRTSALQEYVWCTDEATHLEAAHGTLSDQS